MPEGPEVKHVVDQLNKYVTENICIIEDIKIHSGRYRRHGAPEGFDKINFPCLLKVYIVKANLFGLNLIILQCGTH